MKYNKFKIKSVPYGSVRTKLFIVQRVLPISGQKTYSFPFIMRNFKTKRSRVILYFIFTVKSAKMGSFLLKKCEP